MAPIDAGFVTHRKYTASRESQDRALRREFGRLHTRIDKVESGLHARIDKLDSRIGNLDSRIDKVESGLHARIDNLGFDCTP
ncbi:hypothetical protein B0T22DRAFT_114129 [Podospora appendiculata]|uniref:t-SNARE coiled-coil homology domain-containing protein n=1 Tax=Podospora appendiculata TaxID=314037 RepID=A0AAE0XLN0_9PEZI|nr:hypothetical protein B0T22DRAFT_114129 [Podospora appendiculata]